MEQATPTAEQPPIAAGLAVTTWLIDKSAPVRLAASPDAAEWANRIQRGLVRIPDLLIAATAELAGLTILHHDKDFGLVTAITGQPAERLTLP